MIWNRREVLATLGVGAAQLLVGCRAPVREPVRPFVDPGEVRTWLRDAVARLHAAGFTHARALAVSRRQRAAAVDVMGVGMSYAQTDGVVLATGSAELVTSDLSGPGVAVAARALAGSWRAPAALDFGRAPASVAEPRVLADYELLDRATFLAKRDTELSSRIVYASALIDVDDAHVWAVGDGYDLEQRVQRVQKTITRVAWNGTRPVVSEVARAWAGNIDDQDMSPDDLAAAREHALALMTPAAFPDGEHAVALDPSVVALMIDAAVRTLLTAPAARRPEVARRLAVGRRVAAPLVTLVDDPLAAGAYGGFAFDDRGQAAAALTLVDRGQVAGVLPVRSRPGHVGPLAAAPSHLRLAAGTVAAAALLDEGFELEGGLTATVDPSSDRVVVAAARARERKAGSFTGRIYADIELVGELAPLLAGISAASTEVATFGARDDRDGLPLFRSITAPALRTRGMLRARRRLA